MSAPAKIATAQTVACNCSEFKYLYYFLFLPTVFRGFWTVLIILGLVAALTGGFLLVCGVSFISHKLFKLGGAFLVAAGKI